MRLVDNSSPNEWRSSHGISGEEEGCGCVQVTWDNLVVALESKRGVQRCNLVNFGRKNMLPAAKQL
jgi:hypothetical protein